MTSTQPQPPLLTPPGDSITYTAILRAKRGDGRTSIEVTFTARGIPLGGRRSIEHVAITEPYTEVRFEGAVYARGAPESDPWAFGQIQDHLPVGHPLRTLWDRWHLNGMRSHCIHQDPNANWDEVPPCPESGYRCGTEWLVEPLPLDVVRTIIALMSTTIEPTNPIKPTGATRP